MLHAPTPEHTRTLSAVCILYHIVQMVVNKAAAFSRILADQECHNRMGAAALPYLVVATAKAVTTVAKCLQLGVIVRISDSASTGFYPLFVVNPGRSSSIPWCFN